MLSGMEKPTSGEIRVGHNVIADYFAQDQYKVLDGNARMLEDITGANPASTPSRCARCSAASCSPATTSSRRSACSPAANATATPSRACSSRPPTSSCSTSPPTTSNARQGCAARSHPEFSGTVVFVSHDRYFIDGLATRVFEVEDRRVHIYPGNYEDYLFRKTGVSTDTASLAAQVKTDASTGARSTPPPAC